MAVHGARGLARVALAVSKNMEAGLERLTEEERRIIAAILADGGPDAEARAFREQLRMAREHLAHERRGD